MIPDNLLKGALTVLSAGAGGFYLGGRYVGSLAQETYISEKPGWIVQAQETMWLMLAVCAVCVIAWVVVDYRVNND